MLTIICYVCSVYSRRSSMMSSGRGYETLKDPRPVSDRGYKDRCMRELVQVKMLTKWKPLRSFHSRVILRYDI